MAENRELYVKYLDNHAVAIDTSYGRGPQGSLALLTVAHLIGTVKQALAPLLNDTSIAELTLHLPEGVDKNSLEQDCFATFDESDTTLRPGLVLSRLNGLGLDDLNPLVIKSRNDTITMDEHMIWRLPQPEYDNHVSRPNTSGSTWKKPTHVFHWSDFQQSVVSWIEDNHYHHSQRVDKPVFVARVITEEVQTLQPFILDNLLNVSAKCFIPTSEFKARRQITSCVGEPDHLMTRNGEIVAIVEEKGNWTLPTGDVVNAYDTTRACASAVNQLYHYMRLNHRKYGILSSYENTWFVYRSQECDICEEPQGHETLYVSKGIAFTAQNPTVQQCLSYFNSIVNHVHMDSPPASKRPSRAGSATQISRTSSPRVSPRGSLYKENSPLSCEIQINQQPQDFDVDNFKFDTVLGEGRSKVYLDYYGPSRIALKVADIAKHREMLPELLNEVSVYEQLSGLQGNGIPRFVCHGYVENVLYCVGVSICGTVANGFTEQQKQKLLETLQSIHEAGILHNDIKKENILIDESGNPYIIDFGFSTRNCSPVAQMKERNLLLSLVEST
jgi:predicted Ser/Thr protein kinase